MKPEASGPAGRRAGVVAAATITLLGGGAAAALASRYLSSALYESSPEEGALARLVLAVLALVVATAWVTTAARPRLTPGLAVAAGGWILPLLATSTDLPIGVRSVSYAAAPAAAAGLSLMFGRWRTEQGPAPGIPRPTIVVLILTGLAAPTLVLGYEPFADPGCTTACIEVAAPLAGMLSTRTAVIVSSLLVAGAAAILAGQVGSVPGPPWLAGLCALAVLTLTMATIIRPVEWASPGREDAETALTTASLALVTAAALAAALLVIGARRAMDDVVAELTGEAADPTTAYALLESVPDASQLGPAAQLALSNARLRALSGARMAEVQDSRRRIVTTSDAERRRIERDLHDGAQQRLVSASLQLAIAADQADPITAIRVSEASTAVREALAQLRLMSRGVYPSALSDEGLGAALEDLAAGAGTPVELEVRTSEHFDPDAAMAAYAMVAQMLGAATEAEVDQRFRIVATAQEDAIRLVVTGRVDPAVWPSVLGECEDRIGALGGTVDADVVEPELMRLSAVIPCAS